MGARRAPLVRRVFDGVHGSVRLERQTGLRARVQGRDTGTDRGLGRDADQSIVPT
jgi:hypothetical protein